MNLGRETKSAVSSRNHNTGSDRSKKSFTKKPSKRENDGNVNESKLNPIIENNGVKQVLMANQNNALWYAHILPQIR